MNQPVASLNLPPDLIHKLEQAGFCYCNELSQNMGAVLSQTTISAALEAPRFQTAGELCHKERKFVFLGTPISELDSLLGTVIAPGCVTEFCGFPGSGKTQLCLNLAIGMNGEVVFIHTNKNLNPERLRELCGSQESDVMNNMFCIEASDPIELLASVEFLEDWLSQHCVRLILIDSISWPVKQHPAAERGSLLCTLLQKLRVLGNKHSLAIVVTNDLTTRLTGGTAHYTSCFGDSFYHLVNNRVLLSRQSNDFRAEILKSVGGHHGAVSFKIYNP